MKKFCNTVQGQRFNRARPTLAGAGVVFGVLALPVVLGLTVIEHLWM